MSYKVSDNGMERGKKCSKIYTHISHQFLSDKIKAHAVTWGSMSGMSSISHLQLTVKVRSRDTASIIAYFAWEMWDYIPQCHIMKAVHSLSGVNAQEWQHCIHGPSNYQFWDPKLGQFGTRVADQSSTCAIMEISREQMESFHWWRSWYEIQTPRLLKYGYFQCLNFMLKYNYFEVLSTN